jgi:hypothetical protein
MTWLLTEDPDEYLAAAGAFLTSDPVANTTLLVVAERLRSEGGNASGRSAPGARAGPDRAPLLGWWRPAGTTIAGAFLHTPPYPVVLTSMTPRHGRTAEGS